jgi:hypothetical protein
MCCIQGPLKSSEAFFQEGIGRPAEGNSARAEWLKNPMVRFSGGAQCVTFIPLKGICYERGLARTNLNLQNMQYCSMGLVSQKLQEFNRFLASPTWCATFIFGKPPHALSTRLL